MLQYLVRHNSLLISLCCLKVQSKEITNVKKSSPLKGFCSTFLAMASPILMSHLVLGHIFYTSYSVPTSDPQKNFLSRLLWTVQPGTGHKLILPWMWICNCIKAVGAVSHHQPPPTAAHAKFGY